MNGDDNGRVDTLQELYERLDSRLTDLDRETGRRFEAVYNRIDSLLNKVVEQEVCEARYTSLKWLVRLLFVLVVGIIGWLLRSTF